ncbi:MAG: MFS transporter [Actinomycetota bacterium]
MNRSREDTRSREDARTETGHPRRWWILAVLCGALVLVVVSVSSLNVAIPAIQRSLDASGSELQWIIDAYALAFAGLLLPAGAIGDRYGRREALLAGLVVFLVASIGGMAAGSATALIVWRALMGAGAALIMPATLSIVATVFAPGERSKAIAIWAGFAGAGGVVGLLSSGLLLRWFWWGAVFAANLPLTIAMLALVVLLVPTSRDPEATPLDPIGAVASVVGLGALVFGVIEGAEKGWTAGQTIAGLAVAAIALAVFVVWEFRTTHPMLDPRFFADRRFSLGSLTITAAFFGIFGMFFVLTQYLQFVHGHDALGAGLRIMPYGVVLLLVAPRAAPLADRFGPRRVMVVGMVVAAAGFAGLSVDAGEGPLLVGLALAAVGTGLLMPPATTALVESLPPAKAGVGSAMNDATREVGGALGIAVVGALLAVGYRSSLDSAATAELTGADADRANDSLGGLLAVADGLDATSAEVLRAAGRTAFTDGMGLGLSVAAGLLALGAVLVALLHPRHHRTGDPNDDLRAAGPAPDTRASTGANQ